MEQEQPLSRPEQPADARARSPHVAARIREKQSQIARCRVTIARADTPPERRAYLLREIARMEAYLAKKGVPRDGQP